MSGSVPLPQHIGIIMDGNGRWARQRNLKRSAGHKEGLKSAKTIVKEISSMGIPFLSLYVFSTENWKRTEDEISFLMQLIRSYLKKEYQFYLENQIKVVHSGDMSSLPKEVQADLLDIMDSTKDFSGLTVNLLINYGGQDEIIRAGNRMLNSSNTPQLSIEGLSKFLDQPQLPPLDLVVRTAGEMRLSNFMVWQASYSEFVFLDTLWPDFTVDDLNQAIEIYLGRKRKFGGY